MFKIFINQVANQGKQTRVLDSIIILPLKKKNSIIIQTGYGQARND